MSSTGTAGTGIVLADHVVEVLHARGDRGAPQWSAGSGFRMHGAVVLTAAHVVGPDGALFVRFRGVVELPARLCTLPDGTAALDERLDLALLEILPTPSDPAPAHDVPPVPVARLHANPTLDLPNLDGCVAFGFPAFQRRTRPDRDRPVRESVRVDGYIPTGEGSVEGLATLRVRDAPQDAPPDPAATLDQWARSEWRGISGAVVFAAGRAVGVVGEHHRPAGVNALTVVPLTWLDRRPDAADWWALLGVTDPAALPQLPPGGAAVDPAGTDDADATTEERYRALLLRTPGFTRLPTLFDGLPPEFYLPRLLRAETPANTNAPAQVRPVVEVMAEVRRLVVLAPAGMGKTELLHELVRAMAADPDAPLPVFVRLHDLARRGEGHDLLAFAVTETVGDRVDPAEAERIVAALRRRRDRDGDAVVFLFDGLDEVPAARQHDVLARVRKVDRFVLTTRPTGRVDVLPDGAPHIVDGLTDDAVAWFVRRWETRNPAVRTLLDGLADDPRLRELARYPQLLLLLCWLWRPDARGMRTGRTGILATAVDEAFARAARLTALPEGYEDVVPVQARRALRQLALASVTTGEDGRLDVDHRDLLAAMDRAGGPTLTGPLLAFARRTGLVVASPAGDGVQFLHQQFRALLAGEALGDADDPTPAVDLLTRRRTGEDVLAAAVAVAPRRMAPLVLDRLAAAPEDLFRTTRRTAALAVEGVPDLRELDDRLRPVADAVLEGAREWWSRRRFTPAIGALRTAHMRARLRAALSADDGHLRWAAVEGLRHLGEPDAVTPLLDRLPDEPWPAVRTAIVTALGRLGDPAAIGPLLDHHIHPHPSTSSFDHRAVGESLARLGAHPQLRDLVADLDGRPHDVELGDDPAVDATIEVLTGARTVVPTDLGEEITRVLSARVLLTDPEDLEHHLAVLDDPAATVDDQLQAILALQVDGSGRSVDAILTVLLTTTDTAVRDRAASAMTQLEREIRLVDVVSSVARLFWSDDPVVRADGARALLLLWASPAQDDLLALTFPEPDAADDALAHDEDPRVRAAAAVLAGLGGRPPATLLHTLARDDDALVREAATAALGRLLPDGGADPDLLARLAADPDGRVRITALRALGQHAPDGAVTVVTAALEAVDPEERTTAANLLGPLGDPTAVPALLARLRTEHLPTVRYALVTASVTLGGPGPAPPELAAAVTAWLDGEAVDRALAAHAAGLAGLVELTARLRAVMESDPDEEVRDEASDAYGRLASLDALRDLADRAAASGAGPTSEQLAALTRALAERPDTVAGPLAAHLGTLGAHTLRTTRSALVKIGVHTYRIVGTEASPETEDDIVALLPALAADDPAARWDALDALGGVWSYPGLLGRIALALLDPHVLVADRAAEIVRDLADRYEPDALDDDGLARIGRPDAFAGLVDLLGSSGQATAMGWLLRHVELLPALLRAQAAGHHAVRQVLWELADRHGLRLFPDGRALLATGREVTWDELPAALRRPDDY